MFKKQSWAVAILIALNAHLSFAQSEIFNGKITDSSGDRDVSFKIKEWVNTPISFKITTPNGNIELIGPDEAKEILIPNYGYFISVFGPIETSSDLTAQLSETQEVVFEEKRVFMEVLISGPISLLKLKTELNTRFYLKKGDDIELLAYKRFKIRDDQKILASENLAFRSQLWKSYNCGIQQLDLKKVEYNQKDLTAFFIEYFNCSTNSYELAPRRKEMKFLFNAKVGIMNSNGNVNYASEDFERDADLNGTSPRIDAELEIRFRKSNPISILVNVGYHGFDQSGIWTDIPMRNDRGTAVLLNDQPWELSYSNFSLGFGVQKAFYVNDDLSFDLNLIVNPAFLNFGSGNFEILEVEGFQNSPRIVDFENNNHIAIGGRVSYKKISANLKYWPNQSLKFTNDDLFQGVFQGKISGLSFQLGYSL